MSEAQRKLKDAQAAVDAARAGLQEIRKAEESAKETLRVACEALQAAREEADRELPSCVIVAASRFSSRTNRTPGVIVGRTEKTIKARPFGGSDDSISQYRRDRSGVWCRYPRQSQYYGSEYLEIKDETTE